MEVVGDFVHQTGRSPGQGSRLTGPLGRAFAPAWLCVAMALPGCGGDDGRVPVFPARGKVTVSGETPDGALVVLYPVKSGGEAELRPSGRVKPDGTFRLSTYDADDGAPAGEYRATIQWNKLIKQGNDYKAGPNIVPPAYAAYETSPWKITVAESANELSPLDIRKQATKRR